MSDIRIYLGAFLMNKLSIAMLLVAFTLSAIVAAPALADNEIGLYTDHNGAPTSASIAPTLNTPFNVYLVVTAPVNHAYNDGLGTPPFERVMTSISGFEAQIGFWTGTNATASTLSGLFVLSQVFNGNAIRLGEGSEFVVGFADPVPVSGVAAMMMTPSIPGTMAIVDGSIQTDNLQAAVPSSGNLNYPVFCINCFTATESEKWGDVKALYR